MQDALARLFGDEVVAQVKAADWKLRKEGMEALAAAVVAWGAFSDGVRVGETVQGLSYLPGWGEKNFQARPLSGSEHLLQDALSACGLTSHGFGPYSRKPFLQLLLLLQRLTNSSTRNSHLQAASAWPHALVPASAQLAPVA